jgi:hypothetical protein
MFVEKDTFGSHLDRWEYLTTFDFEWGIYTGKQPWRWSFLAYIAARTLSLFNVTLSLVGYTNLLTEFNCEVCCWLYPKNFM